jgi:type III pantothenate kinase
VEGAFLTADLGNSALKLALWSASMEDRPRPLRTACFSHGDLASVASWLAAGPRPTGVAIASVGPRNVHRQIVRMLEELGLEPSTPPVPAIQLELRSPDRLGADRLFSALGALHLLGAPALIVDAGTALTVDALAPGPVPGSARFLGGAIAPGPRLLAISLSQGTSRLPRVEPEPDVPALGRDTEAALRAGVAVGFAGAARELSRAVAREAGIEGAPIVLTGGAAGFLLRAFDRAPLLEPDLVHIGLAVAAGVLAEGARPSPREEP